MGAEEFTIAAYYKHLAEHKVMASRCTKCNSLFLPPRPICSHCQAQQMAWAELEGEGKILGFTSISIPPSAMTAKGYGRNNPYLSALVEFKEGPFITGRIDGADANNAEQSLQVGMPVQAGFLEEGEGEEKQASLVFRPKVIRT